MNPFASGDLNYYEKWNQLQDHLVNILDNSSLVVASRGTSVAVTASKAMALDRMGFFRTGGATGATMSRQTGDRQRYCMRVARDNGNSNTSVVHAVQQVLATRIIGLRNRYVKFAFRARAGANYSASSSILTARLNTGTAADEADDTSYTGLVSTTEQKTLTTSWQDFEMSPLLIPSNASELGVGWNFTPTGTAGAADHVEIEEMRLVAGRYVGNYRAKSVAEEILNCAHFLPAFTGISDSFAGHGYSTTQAMIAVPFHCATRAIPSGIVVSNVAHLQMQYGNANVASSNIQYNRAGLRDGMLFVTIGSALFTAGSGITAYMNNSSGMLLFTGAEL